MKSKALPYLLLVVLALAVVAIRYCRNDGLAVDEANDKNYSGRKVNRDHGFDRRTSYLEYTQHARCRMECRSISQEEVEEIMRVGKINYRKSDVKDKPCPTYALEGNTLDNQHVRIVFAQCDKKTKVVTAIDLGKEWQCDCPGD